MSPALARFVFIASCLGVLVGCWLGHRQLPWAFEPRPSHPAWVARYESLRGSLVDDSQALYVQEQREGGSHRYFRAQFVLLPVIVNRRPGIDSITPQQLERMPLILDYYSRQGLRKALRQLTAAAGEAGLEIEVERGRGRLALVRARKGGA